MLGVRRASNEEGLVHLHVARQPRVIRAEVQWPGQLVPVEGQAGLDAQAVARSQADGPEAEGLPHLEQLRPERLYDIGVEENLEGHALAGIAGPCDDQVVDAPGCARRGHVGIYQLGALHHLEPPAQGVGRRRGGSGIHQRQQDVERARPLERQVDQPGVALLRTMQIPQISLEAAAGPGTVRVNANLPIVDRLEPGIVLLGVGSVHHHQEPGSAQPVDDQVINHGAVGRQEEGVLGLAGLRLAGAEVNGAESSHVVGGRQVEKVRRMGALDVEDAHVRHIKQARCAADHLVLVADGRVPKGHLPAGKGRHPRPLLLVPVVERRGPQPIRPIVLLVGRPVEAGQRLALPLVVGLRIEADVVRFPGDARRHNRAARRFAAPKELIAGPQVAHHHRPGQLRLDQLVIEEHEPIGKVTQPGDHALDVIRGNQEAVPVVAEPNTLNVHLAQPASISVQEIHLAPLAFAQIVEVHGRDLLHEGGGVVPLEFDETDLTPTLPQLRHETVVRVPAAGRFEIDPGLSRQVRHLQTERLQDVKRDLPAIRGAPDVRVAEGLDGLHGPGHNRTDLLHLLLAQTALRHPGRSEADAAGIRTRGIPGNGVLVDHDADQIEDRGGNPAHQRCIIPPAHRLAVQQEEVCVGAAARDAQPLVGQSASEGLGVGHRLMLELMELLRLRQSESRRHRRKLIHMRPPLQTRENRTINIASEVRVRGQDTGPARSAEGLMRGERHHVGIANRCGVGPRHNHTGNVGDIGQEVRPHPIGDLSELRPVWLAGIGGVAGDDQLRPVPERQLLDLVVVEELSLLIDRVGDRVVKLPGGIDRAAMGQVPPVDQGEAHDRVARFQEGLLHRKVRRGTREGLDVDVDLVGGDRVGGEGLRAAPPGQGLDHVGVLDAPVVAAVTVAPVVGEVVLVVEDLLLVEPAHLRVGIPFGVDVHQRAAEGIPHSPRGAAFRRDHDQLASLSLLLQIDQVGHRRIELGKLVSKKEITVKGHASSQKRILSPPLRSRIGSGVSSTHRLYSHAWACQDWGEWGRVQVLARQGSGTRHLLDDATHHHGDDGGERTLHLAHPANRDLRLRTRSLVAQISSAC